MPGIIEDAEPDENAVPISGMIVFSTEHDLPPFDVETFVDRLRFMRLDPTLVAEAERRLQLDPQDGIRWLSAQLKGLEPPRKPPQCQCGEFLVDVGWRGRATVRCSVCGARWGLEVIDEETESCWQIDGPSREWQETHPLENDDPYGDLQPEDVLKQGLPPLPAGGIEPGTAYPVAMWEEDRHAAVLYVHRKGPGEFDTPADEYEDETEHLSLDAAGTWVSTGSGGGNWINVFDPPADLLSKYVVLGTGTTGVGDDDEAVFFTGGLCSSVVAVVETIDSRGGRRYLIQTDRPFFVVGLFGSGRVRILDKHGAVLPGHRGQPLDFEVNA